MRVNDYDCVDTNQDSGSITTTATGKCEIRFEHQKKSENYLGSDTVPAPLFTTTEYFEGSCQCMSTISTIDGEGLDHMYTNYGSECVGGRPMWKCREDNEMGTKHGCNSAREKSEDRPKSKRSKAGIVDATGDLVFSLSVMLGVATAVYLFCLRRCHKNTEGVKCGVQEKRWTRHS